MIPQSVKVYFYSQLQELFQNCDVVDAAMVSTLDGRLCAEKQRAECASERVSVMGSSLMALGDTILAELRLGACDTVIAESAQGLVLFNHIASAFVLVSMTQSKSSLGSLLSWARRTADDIAQGLPLDKTVQSTSA